jgi:hypothetical protein
MSDDILVLPDGKGDIDNLEPRDLSAEPRTPRTWASIPARPMPFSVPSNSGTSCATLDRLSRLESKGRANLARHSLDTRIGSFVPADGFPKFRGAP